MAKIRSREEFKQYCLRRLGAPVINQEIDDAQIEDRIDDALQYFQDYHADGMERIYMKHIITQEDIDRQYIEIPEIVQGVVGIFDVGMSYSNSMFSVRYQLALNDLFNLTSTSLIPYYTTMRHLETLSEMFSTRPAIDFNRHTNRLYIHFNWQQDVKVGSFLVIECYRYLDPEVYQDIWNDRWLKRYATALMKRQVATHLKKFNITLPGGVTFNASEMYQEADEEIRKLEDEMISSYSLPPSDFIG